MPVLDAPAVFAAPATEPAPAVGAAPAVPPGLGSSLLLHAGRSAAIAALITQTVAKLCKVLKTKSFSES